MGHGSTLFLTSLPVLRTRLCLSMGIPWTHGLDTDPSASVMVSLPYRPCCSFLYTVLPVNNLIAPLSSHGVRRVIRTTSVFRMVGGCASALYELEQSFLNGCELSST